MKPNDDSTSPAQGPSFLDTLPRTDPFVVPEVFFDRFPHVVQAAIVQRQPAGATVWFSWKKLAFALPVAAVAVLGLRTWLKNTPVPTAPIDVAVSPLTEDELSALGENELLTLLENDPSTLDPTDLGNVDIDLDEEELFAYLESEQTDLTELIIELE